MRRFWVVVIFAVGIGYWLIGAPESFRSCVHQHKGAPLYRALYEEDDVLAKMGARMRLTIACSFGSANENNGAISALSGIMVAIFTGTLWWVTWGMEKISERQRQDSIRAADAANKSAEIAEQALISGQRAFVSVVFQATANKNIGSGEITHWGFTPVWQNNGDTPTRNMHSHTSIRIFDEPIPSDWDFPDLWPSQTPPEEREGTPLGAAPRSAVNGQILYVSREVLQEVISGSKFLYMWGWARYRDVFPNTRTHVTRFAVQIAVGGDASDPDRISLSYPFLKRYNCSDEECDRQGCPAEWSPRTVDVG